jgi:hypothetical protein
VLVVHDGVVEGDVLRPVLAELNRETSLRTNPLSHLGHLTSCSVDALRTSSSKGWPHFSHVNSKIGISGTISYRRMDS